jgi:hypothetical protein
MTDHEPIKHWAYNVYRVDTTACGKVRSDVIDTWYPEHVTCEVCIEELKLSGKATTR